MNYSPSTKDEHGAAMVELSFVALLIFVLAMGVVEFGLMFASKMEAETISRHTARVVSHSGRDFDADYRGARAALSGSFLRQGAYIERVIIYDADPNSASTLRNGVPLSLCEFGETSWCNNLTRAELSSSYARPGASNQFGCNASVQLDNAWCPFWRDDTQANATYVGVKVIVVHPYITGFFGTGTKRIASTTIMRVEPPT